jgi:hypothetical protein
MNPLPLVLAELRHNRAAVVAVAVQHRKIAIFVFHIGGS